MKPKLTPEEKLEIKRTATHTVSMLKFGSKEEGTQYYNAMVKSLMSQAIENKTSMIGHLERLNKSHESNP